MAAKSGCWTCKHRKVGCDKTLPHCKNCLLKGRKCLGYGIRLTWPDIPDGRRSKSDAQVAQQSIQPCPKQKYRYLDFLNTTFRDIKFTGQGRLARPPGRNHLYAPGLAPALSLHSVVGQDALLLSYYTNCIATMISTLQIQNGFCQDLLPKALASSDPAATALCNAMLAVSAYHLHGSTSALPYKTKSIAYLSRALSANVEATETQVAASMMLCVYSVFDEAEGNWDVHLDGAKRMLRRWDKLDSDFILTWFLYHEVLGGFTSPSRLDGDETDLMSFVGSSRCDLRMIIGSLGCSLETITIIHKINQLRLRSHNNSHTNISPSTAKERLNLETQLNNLIQTLPPFETSQTPSNQTRTLAIAELYRLASILYLQRVCPMPEDGSNRGFCVRQALNLLNTLEVATSPWPVFVVACESAPSDEYRIAILEVLNRMDQVRGIGNVKVMRGLVESFWKQVDLGRLTKGSWVSWCNAGDGAVAEPWFI